MLAYRPSYLYDVSFQLSALAVAGILLWARPVVGSVSALYPMRRVAVATVVVPIVSTLWTLPVVSCTFGNIPFSGVVITPMVMMLAYMIVGCGIFILLLSPPLSLPFILIGEWIAAVQNYVVCWAVERGITGVDYKATVGEGLLCYAIYGAITLVALSFESKNSNFVMIC
jgi:competence protein ComEC